jgi:hypothetical protein
MGILSSKMGSWRPASSLLTVIILYIVIILENKIVENILRSLFRQPMTSNFFYFL